MRRRLAIFSRVLSTSVRRIVGLLACSLLFAVALPRPADAASYYWTGDHDNNWNTTGGAAGTNWSSNSSFNNDPQTLPGSVDNVFFVLAGSGNLNTVLGQDFSINSLNFTPDATNPVIIGGSNQLTIGAGGLVDNSPAAIMLSTNVALGTAETWANNSTVALTVSGILSGNSNLSLQGTGALTGTATGAFVFSNANTYSGQITLGNDQTSLTLNGNGSFANVVNTTAGLTLLGGSSLILDNSVSNSSTRLASTVGITSDGGTISLMGMASNATSQTVGTLTLGSGQSLVSVPGSGGTAMLTFGTASVNGFSRSVGSAVNFSTTGTIAVPKVTLDTGNLIGGWATIGNVGNVQQDSIGSGNVLNFATVSGGNVAPVSNYVNTNTAADFATAANNVKVSAAGVTLTNNSTSTINSLYLTGPATLILGTVGTTLTKLNIADGGIISNAATTSYGGSGPQIPMTDSADLGSGVVSASGAVGGAITGTITSSSGDLVVTTASNLRIDALIANSGSTVVNLTKDGSGWLDLSDGNGAAVVNTYTGITTINGGLLTIKGDTNLGAVPSANTPNAIVLNGGELRMFATITLATKRGITVGPQGGTISYNGGNTTILSGYQVTGSGSITYSDIPGFGGVSANMCAMNIDFGATNYTGGTTFFTEGSTAAGVDAVIFFGANNQVPSLSPVTVTNATTGTNIGTGLLNLFGKTETFGSLAGNGNILNGLVGSTANLTVGGDNLSTTYSGNLGTAGVTWSVGAHSTTGADVTAGSIAAITLTKVGTGTMTMSGTNGYTGATAINGGAISVTGSLAATPVTVGNGTLSGALGGSGTVAGTVTVTSTGALAPAISPSTTSTLSISNNLTLNAGASLDYNFGAAGTPGTGDSVLVTGTGNLLLNGGTNDVLDITALSGFGVGTYTLLNVSGSGTFTDNASFTINGSTLFNYSVAPSGKSLVLTVTPGNPNFFWLGAVSGTPNGTWDVGTTANWSGAGTTYGNGGNVTFDDVDLAPNGATTISVASGGVSPNAITFNNSSNDYTIGGASINVTGAAGIIKNQSGNATFTNAVTATLTAVNGGALTIGNTGSLSSPGGVNVNSGTFRVNGSVSSATAVTVGGTTLGGASGTPTLSGNGTINGPVTIFASGPGNIAGHLAPSGYIGSASPGQTLNLGGALTINSGANLNFNLNNSTSSGNDQVNVTGSGAVNYGTGGVLNINAYNGGMLAFGFYTLINNASSVAPTGGTAWAVGANNDSNAATRTYQIAVVGQNLDLNVSQILTWGGQNGSGGQMSGGNTVWDAGVTQNFFVGGVTSTTFSTGNDVDFYDTQLGAGSGPAVQNSYIKVAQGGVAPGFLAFDNNSVPYTIDTTGDTTNSGVSGGFASITLNGSSSVTLVGPNTYIGGTTLNAGTLVISKNNSLGATSSLLTFNGGTLRYAPSSTSTDISGRTVTINSNGATIDLNGNNVTYANAIGNNGTGGLTLMDSGAAATLTLGAANTFGNAASAGATEVAILGGTLSISNGNSLGTVPSAPQAASVLINGGTLQIAGQTAFGVATINANRGVTLGASGGTINIPNAASGAFNTSEVAVTYAGLITGGGNLSVTGGSGTNSGSSPYLIELGGANTYTGKTTINNATVSVLNGGNSGSGPANILPATTVLNLVNNGWFVLNNGGSSQQVAGLTGDTTGVFGTTNQGTATPLAIAPATGQAYTFAGVIGPVTVLGRTGNASQLSLTINGPGTGTEILSGANTYGGGTTINSGTLRVANASGTSATGTGSVSVNAGGTLAGNGVASQGFITGGVTVASGASISPSGGGVSGAPSTVGTLTVGALTLNSGVSTASQLNYQVNSSPSLDAIAVTGALALPASSGGTLVQFNFYQAGTTNAYNAFASGTPYQLMTYGGAVSGSVGTLSVNPADVPAGDTYSFTTTASSSGALDVTFKSANASVLNLQPTALTLNVLQNGTLPATPNLTLTEESGSFATTYSGSAPAGFNVNDPLSGSIAAGGVNSLTIGLLSTATAGTISGTYTIGNIGNSGDVQASGANKSVALTANIGIATPDTSGTGSFTGTVLQASVANGGSYANLSSSSNGAAKALNGSLPGIEGSTATILMGQNNQGGPVTAQMTWRTRMVPETPGNDGVNNPPFTINGMPTNPPLAGLPLISDVVNLFGMSSASTGANPATTVPVQTDPFAIQMSFNPQTIVNEGGTPATIAASGNLYLASLIPINGIPTWENTIYADTFGGVANTQQEPASGSPLSEAYYVGTNAFDGGAQPFLGSYGGFAAGSFASFEYYEQNVLGNPALTDSNLSQYLGSWGVDTTNNEDWAIIDHNSEFAVVPEPSTMVLAAIGILGGLFALRRRKAAAV